MKRIIDIVFSTLILTLLISISIITILKPKDSWSYYENRTLTSFQIPTIEALVDGSYFNDFERALCEHGSGRTTIGKIQTWADINLFHRPVVNDVVVTHDNILLSYNEYECIDENTIIYKASEQAMQLSKLNELVKSYGGTFLYVAIPSHYAYFDDLYPSYLNNRSEYTKRELTAFFDSMNTYDIPYLDIGEVWKLDGNPHNYMSSVDHHYTWAGAFRSYQAVVTELNRLTGESLKILDESELSLTTLPNQYMGSRSRKLYGLWNTEERLTYAELNNPIPYEIALEGKIPVTSSVISLPSTQWSPVSYTLYMGGDISETIIQTNRTELPSLLIYGDSFTNAMETILYASFDEMRSLDLRYYNSMSLLDYIIEYQPEFVLCVRDYEQLLNNTGNGIVE